MKNQSGFTLIELLIVIALLGALAVGLLASLDPLEQFKKGTDTGTRNTVSEIQQAAIRYYSLKGFLPWSDATQTPILASNATFSTYLNSIVNAGELKSNFVQMAGDALNKIYVSYTPESVTVCFNPSSKSFRTDPATKYDSAGTLAPTYSGNTGCPNPTASTCFWCVQ